ncbi:zinc ribbon domain-containing protein [Blastopirellula marina]|uniref:Zinc-ribbon domain-containing protein n=1 Tax=Blastopirellula marina TaxID=124 RepID=A0A2S8F3Y1_9BACT|nr:zinc ribbon domain-containing protein [Blastopirellula marina]PQO26644.1 hypothetical protein C5Y98_30150 [Blastopirellula marina]PTL40955.1 zinc ribbon domain-containing protein [Blastopirellula marina]
MFCSECGSQAQGKFCSNCGHPLAPAGPVSDDWENDVRYEAILRVPEVRQVIDRHAKNAKQGMSAETFLSICEKVVDSPVSYGALAEIAQPLWAKAGVRTGKERAEEIMAPIGRTIARAVCSLAKNGQSVESVEQGEGGCVLTAVLPSSIWAMKGELKVSCVRLEHGSLIGAETNIPGQMFDWGKSTSVLAQLFDDLRSDMGLPPSKQTRVAA